MDTAIPVYGIPDCARRLRGLRQRQAVPLGGALPPRDQAARGWAGTASTDAGGLATSALYPPTRSRRAVGCQVGAVSALGFRCAPQGKRDADGDSEGHGGAFAGP